MAKVPSLVTLCVGALKNYILYGENDGILQCIYELPTELFDYLLKQLPALALHKLQLQMPSKAQNDFDLDYDCSKNGRKRMRCGKFNMAWKTLSYIRWPELVEHLPMCPLARRNILECESICDWEQKYWEMHVQNCFDAAAERAMLPSFDGYVGEIEIPGVITTAIGYESECPIHDYTRLRGHCLEFGAYVRYLRLQNVFCNAETSHLLTNSKLEGLLLRRICSKMHVDGLCRILKQNSRTITSLEFINCKISLASFEAICDSLNLESAPMHGVKHFAVRGSKLSEASPVSLPPKLVSFLSSRSLESISFCDDHIGKNCAKLTLMTLLDASSALSTLDLSENNISGWLSDFHCKSASQSFSAQDISKSLQSLRVLNLRGNNLQKNDMEDLRSALIHMPILEILDLADNPIGDDGIKSLIPFFVKNTEHFHLTDLNLKNCKLSCSGATELLEVLLALKYPLTTLSLADNDLGCQIAPPLGDFLATSIRSLDIRDIGLGSSGFLELQISMPDMVNLTSINMSENRGGIQAAEFLGELISKAPELLDVYAGYNLMPSESLNIICSALKIASGKLQHIDLTGNQKLCGTDHTSTLAEFQRNAKPIVQIPTLPSPDAPYDDDP